jgi:hypothetical protein
MSVFILVGSNSLLFSMKSNMKRYERDKKYEKEGREYLLQTLYDYLENENDLKEFDKIRNTRVRSPQGYNCYAPALSSWLPVIRCIQDVREYKQDFLANNGVLPQMQREELLFLEIQERMIEMEKELSYLSLENLQKMYQKKHVDNGHGEGILALELPSDRWSGMITRNCEQLINDENMRRDRTINLLNDEIKIAKMKAAGYQQAFYRSSNYKRREKGEFFRYKIRPETE